MLWSERGLAIPLPFVHEVMSSTTDLNLLTLSEEKNPVFPCFLVVAEHL